METEPDEHTRSRLEEGSWSRRIIAGGIGVVVLILLWLIGGAVLPRWWAQRMGGIIDGRLTTGSLLGVSMGAVFTLLPIFVVLIGWRFRKHHWRRVVGALGIALAVAAPNLLTLGIVLGNGNAAHAGERILDVDGPGFRGGSLVGAVIGALLGIGIVFLASSRRRNKRRAKQLEAELSS